MKKKISRTRASSLTTLLASLGALASCSDAGLPESADAEQPLCGAATYEAESMQSTVGQGVTGGWNLWANGALYITHPFSAGATTITVSARGQSAAGVAPHMRVVAGGTLSGSTFTGGTLIGETSVTAGTYTNHTFTFTSTNASQLLRVEFDNDFYSATTGEDRNLYVDKVTVNTSCSGGGGTGLSAVIFDNRDFTGTTVARTDASVNFDWGTGSPAAGIGVDTFSVRWTGQVVPAYSETYTFTTTSDDGIRLWVNGRLIIDNWTDHGTTSNSGTIALVAGQRHDIKLEYYENGGGAVAKLAWQSPSQARQIIPQSALYPSTLSTVAPVCASVPEGGSATLSCPSGQVVTGVTFASYGNPTGSCGAFTKGTCDAASSSSVVSSACLGKASCALSATNTVFGDPCLNTVKRLNAQVACGAGGSGGSGGSGGTGATSGSGGTTATGGTVATGGTAGSLGTPNVTVDRATEYQTIEGFGFFGAQSTWWSSASSLWSDAWGNQVIKDLGMTIWRNEYYSEEAGQDANWAKQLPVVQGLKRIADANRVPLKFVATVWTPPSSMKCTVASVQAGQTPCTRHPDGLKNGGTLDPSKYSAFAQWLVAGVKKYADAGVSLYAISPQNEPMFVEPYNSAVYDITPSKLNSYSRMIQAVSPIIKQSYPNVKVYGTENMLGLEGQPWFYSAYMDSAAWSSFDVLAYHGYDDGVAPTAGSQLAQYWINVRDKYAVPRGKSSWMTETSGYNDIWSDSKGARQLGYAIYAALAYGRASAWIWWQGSELGGTPNQYTLMNGTQTLSKRYYVSKHFYRFIRPGARMVKVTTTDSSLYAVAFAHPTMNAFTLVVINTAAQDKKLTLGGANVPASYSAYRTSASENCASIGTVTNGSITLKADSITTLVNGNVYE